MPVHLDTLVAGEPYERPFLGKLWGYRSWHALARGVFTPAKSNKIILFITKEKQNSFTQYQDHFVGDELHIEGETNHVADLRMIGAERAGEELHLFFRERHHSPFVYYGQIWLASFQQRTDSPSSFVFRTERSAALAASSLATEKATHGEHGAGDGDSEGRKNIGQHVRHERSQKNRARAIALHGTICGVCEFDFNAVYGASFARSYIEVHHLKSLAAEERVVNPETDLIPLCSNCHSMAHRERGRIAPLDELRELIRQSRTRKS